MKNWQLYFIVVCVVARTTPKVNGNLDAVEYWVGIIGWIVMTAFAIWLNRKF